MYPVPVQPKQTVRRVRSKQSDDRRREESERTTKMAEYIAPGFKWDRFQRMMRDQNPDAAVKIVEALHRMAGVPARSEFPVDPGV